MGEQTYRLAEAIRDLPRNLRDSVFRQGLPTTDQERSAAVFGNLFLHVHPVKVHEDTLRFGTTLGLGLISFYLFLILLGSGVLLMFYYVPSTDLAYQSMKDIEFAVSFGMVLRNVHRWAAHGMVIAVFLHMWRVFATGAYKAPREFNWVIGICLLALTLLLSFTGYLLPWDQLAFWAITVGTSIVSYVPGVGEDLRYLVLGGNAVGQSALLRFYVLHCVVLPLFMGVLIGIHFWRIRMDGGLSRPSENGRGEEGK
jgi:quinol-cytochrome oxidoreductase complex cytochrome b subunit